MPFSVFVDIFHVIIMADKDKIQSSGGFAKTTNFKWLGVGVAIFALLALMPTPESMVLKASEIFGSDLSPEIIFQRAFKYYVITVIMQKGILKITNAHTKNDKKILSNHPFF